MKRGRIAGLCAVVALSLLLCGVAGVLALKGDWRYRLLHSVRINRVLPMREVIPTESWQSRDRETLLCEGAVLTDHLILVNRECPLSEGWEPPLSEKTGFRLQPSAETAYLALRQFVYEETDTYIRPTSGYRSPEEQAAEYEKRGEEIAARPGESEHETGLALDLCVTGYGGMSFLKTRAGRLVNEECWRYGFVIRYPLGRSAETGFDYEPWHVRYVGKPHAEFLTRYHLTLEEYFARLTPDVWFEINGYLVLRTSNEAPLLPTCFLECEISRGDEGYWIYTVLCSNVVENVAMC